MLCLTRLVGQSITIGDDITIKVLEISSNKVRLGIDAPSTTGVCRTEKYAERQGAPATIPGNFLGQRIREQKRDKISA